MQQIEEHITEIENDQLAVLAQQGKDNFFFFARAILGFDKLCEKIHLPLCETLQDEVNRRVMIILPRDWFKTTIGSIAYPVWRAVRDPNVRILIVQNTFTNACSRLHAIGELFKKCALLRACYPELLPDRDCVWKNEAKCLKRTGAYSEPTFSAAGTGTQVTGRHFDLIIEDDTVAPDKDNISGVLQQPTEAEIEKAIGWHRLAHPLLIHPLESQIVVIGTRWVEGDLLQWIEENEPDYNIVSRAAQEDEHGNSDEEGTPVWPERYNMAVIRQLRNALGPYMYSALFLNNPTSPALQVFRRDWITEFSGELPTQLIYATAVDPAGFESDSTTDPDYNVILTIGVDCDKGIVYVVYYDRERMNPGQVINKIFDHQHAYSPIKIVIESNAYQNTLRYWVQQRQKHENTYFMIEPIKSIRSKDERIRGLQPFFAGRKIRLRADMAALQTELTTYPRGKHDDVIDALSMLLPFITSCFRKAKITYKQKANPHSAFQIITEMRKNSRKKNLFSNQIGLRRDLEPIQRRVYF
jgi:predicted phage terminase large subunit-like protein